MTVFISYRRADSAAVTGRVFDRLTSQYGADSVFMDVDSIPLGVDFRTYIRDTVLKCDVLISIIGSEWLQSHDGHKRLEDPDDPVRVELESALQATIPVIPVLIDDAPMPTAAQLPVSLAPLAYRNAARVDIGRDFHAHIDRLITEIDELEERAPHGPAAPRRSRLRHYLLLYQPSLGGWAIRAVIVWGVVGVVSTSMATDAEGSFVYVAMIFMSYLTALGIDDTSPPHHRSASARYLLWFMPQSAWEWVVRIVFLYATVDTIALLLLVLYSNRDGETIGALIGYAVVAAVFYGIAVSMNGRPRQAREKFGHRRTT